jgi:uncharacterized protein (TIGR00297 family)
MRLDSTSHDAKGRDWAQVLANGLVGALLAAYYAYRARFEVPNSKFGEDAWVVVVFCAYLGHYACCCGDTWASELGMLSTTPPRFILTGEPVAAGTNGGVSPLGLLASLLGGKTVGFAFAVALRLQGWNVAVGKLSLLGAFGGLLGSLVDSLVGATLQATYISTATGQVCRSSHADAVLTHGRNVLSNTQVNVVASVCTTACIAYMGSVYFQP